MNPRTDVVTITVNQKRVCLFNQENGTFLVTIYEILPNLAPYGADEERTVFKDELTASGLAHLMLMILSMGIV